MKNKNCTSNYNTDAYVHAHLYSNKVTMTFIWSGGKWKGILQMHSLQFYVSHCLFIFDTNIAGAQHGIFLCIIV